ncbi:hypothetical protein D3C78_1441720 [compost metagenome]
MEAILLAGGETLVVGILADRLEFIERQRFDFLEGDFLDLHRRLRLDGQRRLRFRLGDRHHLGIEAGQGPAVEAADILGANQLAGRILGDHAAIRLRSSPRRPRRRERSRRIRPCDERW